MTTGNVRLHYEPIAAGTGPSTCSTLHHFDVILPFHNNQIQATSHHYDGDGNSSRTSDKKRTRGQGNDIFSSKYNKMWAEPAEPHSLTRLCLTGNILHTEKSTNPSEKPIK